MTAMLSPSGVTVDAVRASMLEIVGAANCLSDEAEQAPYVTDYRKVYRGRATVVVRPNSTKQVSEIMRWCFTNGVSVVPQGGNTSLMGGAVPEGNGLSIVLSLARMNKVIKVDPVNDTITVEAGVTLYAARTAAEQNDRLFPLRIGSEGSCQIGGNLSTNAGGTAVLRYGNMRDLVLGVEAVTADGRIYSGLRGLRKDNTGYDLKQLFLGSEGTLGIITAAVLKMYPMPTSSAVALFALRDPAAAVRVLGRAKAVCGQSLTAFELISAPAMDLVLKYLRDVQAPFANQHEWFVLVELTSTADQESTSNAMMDLMLSAAEVEDITDGVIASNLSQAQTFWRIREEISDAQTAERGSVRCDVSVPISEIATFIESASTAVLAIEPSSRMVIYGHMGDGNVHFNPLRPQDVPADAFVNTHAAAISRAVDDIADATAGSISAEHGIGVAKRDELLHYKSREELEIMWSIKRALDPTNILNPGKVLPELTGDFHESL